jgi:hypothetical protein
MGLEAAPDSSGETAPDAVPDPSDEIGPETVPEIPDLPDGGGLIPDDPDDTDDAQYPEDADSILGSPTGVLDS